MKLQVDPLRPLRRPMVNLVASALLIILIVGPTPSGAAETKTTAQPNEANKAAATTVAIPPGEIIPRSEAALRALQEVRFQLAADSDAALAEIEQDITDFAERSDRRWHSEPEMMRGLRSLQRLNDILREWSLDASQLDRWDRALTRRSQILVAQEHEVAQIYDTWLATREAGAREAFPKIALQKVSDVLREADAVRGLIRNSMAKLLDLQSQLAGRREILAKIRGDIDRARGESGRNLFVLDSPPLWQALFQPGIRDVVAAQAVQSLRRFSEDLQEFFQKYAGRVVLETLFLIALLALFRRLSRRVTAESMSRLGEAPAGLIFGRWFATCFLLALIPIPLLYPEATAAVLRITTFFTVIPLIRLLPGWLARANHRWLYLLIALYVIDFFRYLLPSEMLLARMLLLITAVSGSIGIALFLRERRRQPAIPTATERLILWGLRVTCLLLVISIFANLIGNMTLAEILAGAPIRVIYFGLFFFTAALLLMTLTAAFLQSRPAMWLRSVRVHGTLIAVRCRAVIKFLAIAAWLSVALFILGLLGDFSAALSDLLNLRWKVGAAEISVKGVAVFLAVFFGAVIISRILRFLLSEEILPRFRLPRGAPGAVDVLSRYGILLSGFFIALAAAGVDLSKVTLLVSALGVGIGFGLQNVVNNFVSGLILVFEHPLQVGDQVEVGTISGEVSKIGFRASVLRTPDGADVVIPNGEFIGAKFVNWSLTDRLRRISITVNVAYGTDPKRVIEVLLEIARKHPNVFANPEPVAIFDRFLDSALSFTLLCWTSLEQFFLTRSELTVAVNNVFSEARIEIPFPQQEIRVQLQEQQPRSAQVLNRQIAETIEQERVRLSTRSQASSK